MTSDRGPEYYSFFSEVNPKIIKRPLGIGGTETIEQLGNTPYYIVTQFLPGAIRILTVQREPLEDSKALLQSTLEDIIPDHRIAFLEPSKYFPGIRTTVDFQIADEGIDEGILEINVLQDRAADLSISGEGFSKDSSIVALRYKNGLLIQCTLQSETPREEAGETLNWRQSLPILKGRLEDALSGWTGSYSDDHETELPIYERKRIYRQVENWATAAEKQILETVPEDEWEEYKNLFDEIDFRNELILQFFYQEPGRDQAPDPNNLEQSDEILSKVVKEIINLYKGLPADHRQILELTNISEDGFDWEEVEIDMDNNPPEQLINEGRFTFEGSDPSIQVQGTYFNFKRGDDEEDKKEDKITVSHQADDKHRTSWSVSFKLSVPQDEIIAIYKDPQADFLKVRGLIGTVSSG